jgi:hypothetical protein
MATKKKKKKASKSVPWTKKHDRILVEAHNQGQTPEAISRIFKAQHKLKRNAGQCASRLSRIRMALAEIAPKELEAGRDSKTRRLSISKVLLARLHGQPAKKPGKKSKKKTKLSRQAMAQKWLLEHDRILAPMYNAGEPFAKIAKALTKKFPNTPRTEPQCRSRIGNVRQRVLARVSLPQRRVKGGGQRYQVTEEMLKIYHNLPRRSPRPSSKTAPKVAATKPKVTTNNLSSTHKAKFDLDGVNSLTVTLEGKFAKDQELRKKVSQLISDAAAIGSN